jgi:hypothetical protein
LAATFNQLLLGQQTLCRLLFFLPDGTGSILAVHVGAILTVPGRIRLQRGKSGSNLAAVESKATENILPMAHWDLLGKSLLDRAIERLQAFGVGEISVIAEQTSHSSPDGFLSASTFWTAWEEIICRCLQFDLETLLLVRVGPYVELDVTDWLRFHRETFSAMTQVSDHHGALDLVAVDAKRLAQGTGSFRSRLRDLIPGHQRYYFNGYSNRLSNVGDFRRLVKDALNGLAGIRPVGKEISANIWVGEDARIEESARILAPAYIGKHSRVNAACTISGASAIEQWSQIDCGTTVHDSCVLAGSYVGTGLKVCGSVVCQKTLFHLRRDLELQFQDRRLFGKTFTPRALLLRKRGTAPAPRTQSVLH